MYLLILFLIFLLIIFIYNNSKSQNIENYVPTDYSSSIDIRICKGESNDILIPEYDREFNLNELTKITEETNKINEETNKINEETNKINKINKPQIINKKIKIINEETKVVEEEIKKIIKLPKIRTYIEDQFYHTHNLEMMDNFELTKSDYSIINNIKLEENQAFVPKNYSINIK
jgi:hypothetical protein